MDHHPGYIPPAPPPGRSVGIIASREDGIPVRRAALRALCVALGHRPEDVRSIDVGTDQVAVNLYRDNPRTLDPDGTLPLRRVVHPVVR